MKANLPLILIVLLISAVCLSLILSYYKDSRDLSRSDLFFGVSFGLNTTEEAKLLIDRVSNCTNLFLVNSWDISINETALNEVCNYASDANLHFIVFFDFISHIAYPWHLDWLDNADDKWGDKFLGIYLYDEPGGRQIDEGQWDRGDEVRKIFENVSDYEDASDRFVMSILNSRSMQDLKERSIPAFTSDYALYWFDYLAGYDSVFVELGWNHSRNKHIALCRGAANTQNKDWGAIITWTYKEPPYLESGEKILQDMITAYHAGAKYIVVFNWPKTNPYGILEEEHFTAMQDFWNLTIFSNRTLQDKRGRAAFVLPKDYGWGMRSLNDRIWGFWPADDLSPLIIDEMNRLIGFNELDLDIIYDDPRFSFRDIYTEVHLWNATDTTLFPSTTAQRLSKAMRFPEKAIQPLMH